MCITVFESFTEDKIKYHYPLTICILISWSVSLLQFMFVIVATKQKVNLPQYTDEVCIL